MTQTQLYRCWGGMFILCAGLGFIPQPDGGVKGLLILAALVFFVPGAVLLYRAQKANDAKTLRQIRNIAALSLGVTFLVLIINFLSVQLSDAAGQVLYWLLIIVSTPMICAQYWVMGLFLWACLLTASISALRKLKN